MATFPKPLCELRALWGERQSGVSLPVSCPAGKQTPSSTTSLPPKKPAQEVTPK
jgi:hypothetical protein